MVVIALNRCPARLRGDLTKWLLEIKTGVYVGQLSARVREEIWGRICANADSGGAAMVYSDQNEQGFSMRVHNTAWEMADFDGITLMRRPVAAEEAAPPRPAPKRHEFVIRPAEAPPPAPEAMPQDYTVVDLETTGLSSASDEIVELGALRVRGRQIEGEFHRLIAIERDLPDAIVQLTGIDRSLLLREGKPMAQAMGEFLEFIGRDALVCHYAPFELSFLQAAFKRASLDWRPVKIFDTRAIAKEKRIRLSNYKLLTLAQHFGVAESQEHRALSDCRLIHAVFLKLNENG